MAIAAPGVLLGIGKLTTELDRLNLIDEYKFLVRLRFAGHGPTLYQSGLPSTVADNCTATNGEEPGAEVVASMGLRAVSRPSGRRCVRHVPASRRDWQPPQGFLAFGMPR